MALSPQQPALNQAVLTRLYPQAEPPRQLPGCYLDLKLHQQAKKGDVFIYANYISSLDGRISWFDNTSGEFAVPDPLGNKRDWRLYQELAGQADVMITSARYFRQLAKGQAQDLLPVGSSPAFSDIKTWRQQQGLKPQPDVIVLSHSLDIPFSALSKLSDRKVIVLTTSQNASEIHALQSIGVAVLQAKEVTGAFVRATLIRRGYQSAYMIAGPHVFKTLLADASLDNLFLTTAMRLLGGKQFHTILEDDLPHIVPLTLHTMYLDAQEQQLFQRFTCK